MTHASKILEQLKIAEEEYDEDDERRTEVQERIDELEKETEQ